MQTIDDILKIDADAVFGVSIIPYVFDKIELLRQIEDYLFYESEKGVDISTIIIDCQYYKPKLFHCSASIVLDHMEDHLMSIAHDDWTLNRDLEDELQEVIDKIIASDKKQNSYYISECKVDISSEVNDIIRQIKKEQNIL